MISPISPGDYDPACEPEPECRVCSDILELDSLDEWFCPTCEKKETENDTQTN